MANSRHDALLVASIAIAVHATALRGGFVWLDHAHIEDGLALAAPSRWHQLFTQGFAGTGFYRPLMALSLALDGVLTTVPALFHFTTLLWHAAASALVVFAGASIGISRRAATVAGVVFAIHPLTSLVASAIAFRSESMLTAALLALVVLHQRRHPAAGVALLAGALTKETALVLGPLFVIALSCERRAADRSVTPPLALWAAEAAALLTAVALRVAYAPAWRATFSAGPLQESIGTRLATLAKSAWRMLVPVEATICDSFSITSLVGLAAIAGALVLLGLLYLAYARRGPAILLLLSLLPSLQLVPVMRWWSPHYLYLPLAFAAMLIGEVLDRIRSEGAHRIAFGAATTIAVWTSFLDLRYENDETLWGPEIAADPTCREGHFYLAEVARQKRDFADAAQRYELALMHTPGVVAYVDRVPAWQNLGVVQLERSRYDDARNAFRSALGLVVDDEYRRVLTHNLATTELRAGNAAEAARLLDAEAARSDAFGASLFIRARAFDALGRSDEAREIMHRFESVRSAP